MKKTHTSNIPNNKEIILSILSYFVATILLFHDLINYFSDSSAQALVLTATAIALTFTITRSTTAFVTGRTLKATAFLLFFLLVVLIFNAAGSLISPYPEAWKFAFFRIAPVAAAFFIASNISLNRLKPLIYLTLLTNFIIATLELYFSKDIFPLISQNFTSPKALNFSTIRANGFYWYSIPLSTTALFALILISLQPSKNRLIYYSIAFSLTLMTYSRMAALLASAVILKDRLLSGRLSQLLTILFTVLLGSLLIYYSWEYLLEAFSPSSRSNSLRIDYWMLGLHYLVSDGLASVIFPFNVGITSLVGNGFENQFIQYLTEYGVLYFIFFFLSITYMGIQKSPFILFIVFISFMTLRPLDSYSSGLLAYLIFFYSFLLSQNDSTTKQKAKNNTTSRTISHP